MRMRRVWWEALKDLAYPRNCLGCGEALGVADPWANLCLGCVRRLDFIAPPHCHTCGHPFPGMGRGQRCEHCRELEPVFAEGRCCLLHRDLAATLVRLLKYRDGRYLGPDVRAVFATIPGLRDYVNGVHLVPVPLHRSRERERGFNQSRWLAECLATFAEGEAVVADLLERTRWTGSQTRLSREERARNVRRAFVLKAGTVVSPDLTYAVVDDVFTTGATLNECARVLQHAGARHLKVLTLAHG